VTFFIDANIVIYAATPGPMHEACALLMDAIGEGAPGRMSTAVVEEIWYLELSGRVGEITGLALRTHSVFTPLLAVTDEIVVRALALDVESLGANDRIHVATCQENGIDAIVTADADFDGVRALRRVDPLDQPAVTRLLAR